MPCKTLHFRTAFDQAKALLRDCSAAFIDIDNPLEFYLFEAFCAMELDTSRVEHVSDPLIGTGCAGKDLL